MEIIDSQQIYNSKNTYNPNNIYNTTLTNTDLEYKDSENINSKIKIFEYKDSENKNSKIKDSENKSYTLLSNLYKLCSNQFTYINCGRVMSLIVIILVIFNIYMYNLYKCPIILNKKLFKINCNLTADFPYNNPHNYELECIYKTENLNFNILVNTDTINVYNYFIINNKSLDIYYCERKKNLIFTNIKDNYISKCIINRNQCKILFGFMLFGIMSTVCFTLMYVYEKIHRFIYN